MGCALYCFFFFNDTATTEIYTLSLHDALPISASCSRAWQTAIAVRSTSSRRSPAPAPGWCTRSEEHTSELQSRLHLVCRLLLEKKNKSHNTYLIVPLITTAVRICTASADAIVP